MFNIILIDHRRRLVRNQSQPGTNDSQDDGGEQQVDQSVGKEENW